MTAAKHHVTIKGVKDGLVFLLDDICEFALLAEELEQKLSQKYKNVLQGPAVEVIVKLGGRMLSDNQRQHLLDIIGAAGNLLVKRLENDQPLASAPDNRPDEPHVMKVIVRSGQTVHYPGSLLILGDVNPGGTVTSDGDIYVLGSLRGVAHAGIGGNEQAIIAASHMKPTQLRIADVISRPPDEWGIDEAFMEFAYMNDGQMKIDKITLIQRVRPHALQIKGE